MERIINIEDSVIKHCEINKALQYNGYPKAIRAKTAEEYSICKRWRDIQF